MDRRHFLRSLGTLPALAAVSSRFAHASGTRAARSFSRVRPGDPSWPAAKAWAALDHRVGGRLVELRSPLDACAGTRAGVDAGGAQCEELFRKLRNPFQIGDDPALTQTSGWVDAWTSAPSTYAILASSAADVAAGVDFARRHRLRLVIKGGGHSYQGTSCSADSLLIWTRRMNAVELHDAFVPRACDGMVERQPAVSVQAGAIWANAYGAVTTRAHRYVQGGGCTTVGVAGLVQSGGFGSFSKNYGTAAAGLLEAEVVTADGAVRTANECANPDLFWALKGGGGGTFGAVTRVTLRTRDLPEHFGGVFGTVKANSDGAFRELVRRFLQFYRERIFNRHWGEQIRLGPANTLSIAMVSQGLSRQQADEVWQPFFQWVSAAKELSWQDAPNIIEVAARSFWDAQFLAQNAPQFIVRDDRPDAPAGNFAWAGDVQEAGQVIQGYRSAWLPASLLGEQSGDVLADALVASSRHWLVALHFNKGLAGAPADAVAAARNTAMNPAALDAFALAIIAGNAPPAFAGVAGHEPDVEAGRRNAAAINRSMAELLKVAATPAAYVSESDYFERNWQQSFWGSNYARLAAIKRTYDPHGLFFVRHGVGSEDWSDDGFTRLGAS